MGDINVYSNGGMGTSNNAYIPKIPNLPENNNMNGIGSGGVFGTGKGSVIKRDSIVFKSPTDNGGSSNYRNNQSGI